MREDCIMTSSYKLKVLLCGAADSGKTELIKKFVKYKFATEYKLTVGVDILTKDIEMANDSICTLSIWDIGEQERFSFIRSTFYKGAAGAIIVFDLSQPDTWDELKLWRTEVKQFAGDIPIILIGNNFDKLKTEGKEIDREKFKKYAESEGIVYFETSSKDLGNVEEAFTILTKKIVGQ